MRPDHEEEAVPPSRIDSLLQMAITDPVEANAIATMMIWRLLRSIAGILIAMDLVLLAIFWALITR